MNNDVESLKGMVGFAGWHLGKGKTVAEVFAMMERAKQFQNVPSSYYVRAIEIAIENKRLCEACNLKVGKVTSEDHELWQQGEDLGRRVTMRQLLERLGSASASASSSSASRPDAGQPSAP